MTLTTLINKAKSAPIKTKAIIEDCEHIKEFGCIKDVCTCNHKQRLEKYSERFDNNKSAIGNPQTWGKRIVAVKLILLLILLTSCGAKTLNKETTKTDSIATETAVVKTDCTATETKEVKFDVVTEDVVIEPVDTTKPIEITNNEGKVTRYKNARLSHKKRKDNTIVIKEKTVNKIVVDSTANEIEVNKVVSSKVVYKEQFNWGKFVLSFWWLWLILIVLGYLAYRYYKGYLKFPLL